MSAAAGTDAAQLLLRRLTSPVRDPRGGFSALKSFTLLVLCLPASWLAARYWSGLLGARPVLALVHGTGIWSIRLVLVTLALTPARLLLDWPQLPVLRRMIGVSATCYAALHLTLFAAQQDWRLLHVAAEIARRFYLLIGLAALSGLLVLAATSFDRVVRSMGPRWKRLHRLVYGVAALGLLHYALQAKADVGDAVILAGLFVWLMLWRQVPAAARRQHAVLLSLGIAATLATAGIELAWYGLATHVALPRILLANLQFARPRPAAYVALWSVGAWGLISVRRLVAGGTGQRGATGLQQKRTKVLERASRS